MKTAKDILPQVVGIIETLSLNNIFQIAHSMALFNALVMSLKKKVGVNKKYVNQNRHSHKKDK
jgi:hypothetical protein